MRSRAWLLALLGACSGTHTLGDLEGQSWDPLQLRDQAVHVVLFVTTDCPIANSYAPEIRAIAADYAGRGVRLFLVHVDRSLRDEAARAHQREFELPGPVLIDRDHQLVRALGAHVTPEAFVLTRDGIAYRGRIDDAWADLGQRRSVVGSRDLRAALDAVLAGDPVPVERTEAVGCTIGV